MVILAQFHPATALGRLLFRDTGICQHVVDRLFAGPAFGMNSRIDDKAHRTEQFSLQSTEIVVRIVLEAHFPRQLGDWAAHRQIISAERELLPMAICQIGLLPEVTVHRGVDPGS